MQHIAHTLTRTHARTHPHAHSHTHTCTHTHTHTRTLACTLSTHHPLCPLQGRARARLCRRSSPAQTTGTALKWRGRGTTQPWQHCSKPTAAGHPQAGGHHIQVSEAPTRAAGHPTRAEPERLTQAAEHHTRARTLVGCEGFVRVLCKLWLPCVNKLAMEGNRNFLSETLILGGVSMIWSWGRLIATCDCPSTHAQHV